MRFLNNRMGRITALLALGGGTALIAQGVQTGNVAGTVKDATTGKPISGATVILKTPQGDRQTTSDAQGAFRFGLLSPENAQLVISAHGHITASTNLRVNIGLTSTYDFTLKPIQETGAVVVVSAAESVIDPSETKTGENYALQDVNALPINNRTITSIASLTPGVSADSNGITIRGSQATQVQYLVDGADVMDPVTGGPAVRLNEEMLEEVQVVTGGASAEYGRFTGGVVNTTTKSGTNQFSGVARYDFTNLSWNAYNPLDRGARGTYTFPNHTATVQQYVFSGPIIKDHLFFVVGYRTTSPMTSTPQSTTGVDGTGAPIGIPNAATRSEERKDIKLDWQINENNRVFWQYNKTESKRRNIDYPTSFGYASSTVDSLSSQNDTFSYVTFGYLGQISSNLLLSARFNQKKETLGGPGSGGQGGMATTWIDAQSYTLYDNGFFGSDGDSRPIRTANLDATWFVDAMGSHEIKVGAQLFESKHSAANTQTPTNQFIWFNGFVDPTNPSYAPSNRNLVVGDTSGLTFLDVWVPTYGAQTKNNINGYFINDKWKLNQHWAFNLGLRWDTFKSKNDLGVNNFDFSDLSPRLSATYDIFGNNQWVVSYSYDVYVGQVIQGATDSSSVVGNPSEYKYSYLGGDPLLRASWSNTPYQIYDPNLYRQDFLTDPNLKTPRMVENLFTLKHDNGQGTSWSLSVSKRKWDRFVDDFYGAMDVATGQPVITNKNDPSLTRDYFSVEAVYQRQVNSNFSYGFNMTVSELKGNYEGGQVGASGQQNNYGTTPIPNNLISPYGFLAADQPIQFLGNASYRLPVGRGQLSLSALQYYTGGAPYSLAVTSPSLAPAGYGTTFTNYVDGRGNGRFPDTYHTDIQVSYDIPIYSRMKAFARLNITNVFNHQELYSWNTSGKTVTSGLPASYASNYLLPFTPANASFGKPTSAGNYIAARQLNFAMGVRF